MNADNSHGPEPDGMEIPPHFFWQLQALAFVSGKTIQQALTAALAAALPPPSQHPGELLAIAYELMQPGDSLADMVARFQEVRDAEQLPIRDDEITVAVESMSGTIDPTTAALCAEAGDIFNGKEPEPPEVEPVRPGDEWQQNP